VTLVRKNPWKRFRHSQYADLLAWVRAGNVGVIMCDPKLPRDTRNRISVQVWVKLEPLLDEVRAFLQLPVRVKAYMAPFPHFVALSGLPRERALAACGHKKDTRPRSQTRAEKRAL
jgi:hypothetical protein